MTPELHSELVREFARGIGAIIILCIIGGIFLGCLVAGLVWLIFE